MRAVAALALGATLAAAGPAWAEAAGDPGAAVRYFAGTWKCGASTITFAPLADAGPWTRVTYGSAAPEGTAIAGYVAGLSAWVYRDFHRDGAYADLSSPGPNDGRWEWTGPYYPVEGGPPLQDRMTFVERSPSRFERKFELLQGAGYVPTGGDTCTKSAA